MAQGSDICFDHVTFTYPTGEQPAVSDVSFTAKAGTVTALVGHSWLRQDHHRDPGPPLL